MPIFSILFLISTYLWWPNPETFMSQYAVRGQFFCQDLFKFTSNYMDIYKALSCGINPKSNSEYTILKTLSLWHLLVVSGGHLIILNYILDFVLKSYIPLRKIFYIKFFVFIGFAIMTGLQAPILRALLQTIVAQINKLSKLNLTSAEIVLWSGSLCLILFPYFTSSLSLQLSWMASLTLAHFSSKNHLSLHSLIYIFILPVLATLQIPHPISILYNLIFGPVLSMILFPMSLLLMILPSLSNIADHFVDFLLYILHLTASEFTPFSNSPIIPNDTFLLWVFVITLNIYFIYSTQKQNKVS